LHHLSGWLEPKLGPEDISVPQVLSNGVAGVSVGKVSPDQDPICALTQRFLGHSRKACHDRLLILPDRGPSLAQAFAQLKADLALTLPLQDDPIFVPAREEFAGHQQFLEAERRHVGPGSHNEFRKSTHLSHVNVNVR
jgi:hypothetical protein